MAEVNGLKKTIARIKDLEAQVGQRTYELALEYAVLVHEDCGGVYRKAAKIAEAHGLSYAYHASMKKLVLWGEFVNAVKLASGNGVETMVSTPSEHAMRPLLTDHFWKEAGPGGLAELWLSLEVKNPKVFVAAATDEWPTQPTVTPRQKFDDDTGALQKMIANTTPQARRLVIDEYMSGIRASRTFAEDLYDMIVDKWKTWDAFVVEVEQVRESQAIQQKMLAASNIKTDRSK